MLSYSALLCDTMARQWCLLVCLLACSLPIAFSFAPLKAAQMRTDTAPLLDSNRLTSVRVDSPTAMPAVSTAAIVLSASDVAAAVAQASRIPSAAHLQLTRDWTDELGQRHVRFDQVVPFNGGAARVLGGDVIAHISPSGTLTSVTGNVALGLTAVLPPTVTKSSARAAASERAKGRSRAFQDSELSDHELLVIPSAQGDLVSWCGHADLTGPAHVNGAAAAEPALLRMCSEANGAGRVLESRNVLRTAAAMGTGRSLYNGNAVNISTNSLSTRSWEMRDVTRATASRASYYTTDAAPLRRQTAVFQDADNVWGTGTNDLTTAAGRQSAAVDAHWGMAMSVDYYKNVHNRSGIFNTGVGSYSIVHYGVNYENAFWDGKKITYGDGGSSFSPLVSIDVCGHELTHGVTQSSANLIYSGESGGLNEATSDIFGTCIEFYAASRGGADTPDFLIGETITTPGIPGDALRYMHQPSLDGGSPDNWYSGIGSLDVHYSSGPANRCFYLMCQDANLGMTKAEKIWYRALTTYWVSSTNYQGARDGCLRAASDVYGAASAEYAATAAAWSAINVN